MKKQFLTTLSVTLASLILVGAGCSSGTNPNKQQAPVVPTTTEEHVVKKPSTAEESLEKALDFCEAQGHAVVFRFDEARKTNDMFCAFSETVGCEVLDYYYGKCSASTTVAFSPGTKELENLRTCDPGEHPVCGVDGHTYINICIANVQNIAIVHDGACSADEATQLAEEHASTPPPIRNDFPSSDGSSGSAQTPGSDPYAPTTVGTLWLNDLANLLSQRSGTVIEKCPLGNTIYYYQEEGCPNCFSTLYTEGGEVACFPHNDLTGDCPSSFNKDTRGSCSVIWQN